MQPQLKSLLAVAKRCSWGIHGTGEVEMVMPVIPSNSLRLNPDAIVYSNAELQLETLSLSGCLLPAH